jgi:Cu+-exporting ATPase
VEGFLSDLGSASPLIDPVCGMEVDADSPQHLVHEGIPYYFCGASCLRKFAADPRRYLDPEAAVHDMPAPAGATYTCPMHPEIEQAGPGPCPKCGMALELKSPLDGEEDTRDLEAMQVRLAVCAALTLPLLALSMGPMLAMALGHGARPWEPCRRAAGPSFPPG